MMEKQATRYRVLEYLQKGGVVSGGELAELLSISRTAVWKAVAALQEEGYQIVSFPGKGYKLDEGEVYSGYEIEKRLTTRKAGRPLVFLPSVDSTNEYAKKLAGEDAPDGLAVVAAAQTRGKGRLSRSFESPAGMGVYLTILLRPQIEAAKLNLVTLLAAVAVCDTIEELSGRRPDIKWINDVYMNRSKLCGILTECAVEGETGRVSYAAVGIGTNLLQEAEDFPEAIRETAGSVFQQTGVRVSRADYAAALLKNFERRYYDGEFPKNQEEILSAYRKGIFFLGEEVTVRSFLGEYSAQAVDVDGEGRLIVRREDGALEALNSGEISIRLRKKN